MAAFPDAITNWFAAHDHVLMHKVHRWHAPKWLRLWMIAATRGGDGWLWLAMGLAVALYGGAQRIAALSSAAMAVGTGIAVFMKLKHVTGRRRPCAIEPHCWAQLLPPDQFSFPSGHTITAFAVACSLSGFYPEIQLPLYFCAVSVAASRILLGMHFLTDVLAGAVLGGLLGGASYSLIA